MPVATGRVQAATPIAGSLVTLLTPIRVFDSRQPVAPLNGSKLEAGQSVAVTVSAAFEGLALAVFANVTITQTENSGFLVVNGADESGELPVPETSNVNWTTNDQTLANLVLTTVGGESAIEVRCEGNGRTHVIVDVQGYVPFE
ncbi:MAG: hypothetical protein ACRDZZ_08305 [Ilumatobacteraceae bacterium]